MDLTGGVRKTEYFFVFTGVPGYGDENATNQLVVKNDVIAICSVYFLALVINPETSKTILEIFLLSHPQDLSNNSVRN